MKSTNTFLTLSLFFSALCLCNVACAESNTTTIKIDGAQPNTSPTEYPLGVSIDPKQKAYIDSMDVPVSVKKLLYIYEMTPEAQGAFMQSVSSFLNGPTGSSLTTPTAYAADWGVLGIGGTIANHWPTGNKVDGSGSIIIGFGNANKYFGVTVSQLIDSINIFDHRVAENGTFSTQIFHIFKNNFALAFGISNLIPWGAFVKNSKSYYGVGTKIFDIKYKDYSMPLTASLGVGTGQFYSVAESHSGKDGRVLPFGSIGWRVLPRLSLISDWSARQANIGVSFAPVKTWPLILSFADCNINRRDGTRPYLTFSVSLGYNFLESTKKIAPGKKT